MHCNYSPTSSHSMCRNILANTLSALKVYPKQHTAAAPRSVTKRRATHSCMGGGSGCVHVRESTKCPHTELCRHFEMGFSSNINVCTHTHTAITPKLLHADKGTKTVIQGGWNKKHPHTRDDVVTPNYRLSNTTTHRRRPPRRQAKKKTRRYRERK